MSSIAISIAKGKDPYATTFEALKKLPEPEVRNRRVLLKPNVSRMLPHTQGATTNPQVVAAAIDYFKSLDAVDIAIGESPITGVRISEAYEISGIKEIACARNTKLLDFDSQPYQILKIPGGRVINQIKVTWFWWNFDFIVSIPVMKTHMHTDVTLALKNMKGMLWRRQKVVFHQIHVPEHRKDGEKELDLAISDMTSALYPHMAIIDGSIGMEGLGPGAGQPKAADLIVASTDALSADWIATRLMGIDPKTVAHLRLTAAHRTFDQAAVQCIPSDFKRFITPFSRPPQKISFRYPGVQVFEKESCSACLNTLYLFLERYHHRLKPYLDIYGTLNLAVGRGVTEFPSETIFIGNCCGHLSDEGDRILVVGCPPTDSQIWAKVYEKQECKKRTLQNIRKSEADSGY
ncbi:MAG TPA: DUF362 domain-containing protein [Chromatiaceae bacterium]|nr:DUF362 domain-containing protein [Chromatiaceae bacterium]